MAIVSEFVCTHCKQHRYELRDSGRVCIKCRSIIAKANEDAHMAKLQAIPLEERVSRIELQLYRLDAEKRIGAIEAMHARY